MSSNRHSSRRRARRRGPEQLELPARTWGGRRKGAGRPKSSSRHPHTRRPKVARRFPLHITWKLEDDLPNLRGPQTARPILAALAAAREREGFRLIHYVLERRHLHLIVEADSAEALSRALRALAIRIARAINKALGRKGRVFKERYHARPLKTPTQTRHTLRYVLNNERRHREQRGQVTNRDWLDPLSSGDWFDGWRHGWKPPPAPWPVARPATWLLREGWQRAGGLLDLNEVPGPTQAGVESRRRFAATPARAPAGRVRCDQS